MDLVKSIEFFNPYSAKGPVHIIGCGSVGSNVATLLARAGIENFVLYDFDVVEAHNIANQAFTEKHIGKAKTEALKEMLLDINSDLATEGKIKIEEAGYVGQALNGYVFLAVDNIDLRREICKKNKMNRNIKAVFDFRTRLTDGQHYAADWSSLEQIKNLLSTMDFSHDEAHAATPTTACGIELGVAPTVQMVCCVGVSNFINFLSGRELKQAIPFISPFAAEIW